MSREGYVPGGRSCLLARLLSEGKDKKTSSSMGLAWAGLEAAKLRSNAWDHSITLQSTVDGLFMQVTWI